MNNCKRSRVFSFLVYPEGLPDNFIEVLNESGGKGFYILHDLDRLDDGTDKKAHYHVMIMFENARSLDSAKKLGLRCGAANGIVEPVKSAIGYARYLCHMDSPLKHQYDMREVGNFGGADYEEFVATKTERKQARLSAVHQMVHYICENRIYSYAALFEYSCNRRQDWLEALLNPSVGRSIIEYIKSKNWTDNRQANSI